MLRKSERRGDVTMEPDVREMFFKSGGRGHEPRNAVVL